MRSWWSRRPRWQRRAVTSVGAVVLLLAGLVVGASWWANEQFERIPTFEEIDANGASGAAGREPVVLGPVLGGDESAAGVAEDGTVPDGDADVTDRPSGGDLTTATVEPRSTAAGNVFLAFSVGSSGVDAEEADRAAIPAERADMADGLTDSIMVLAYSADAERVAVVSVPRDLWIPSWGNRINAIYNLGGIDAFTSEVERLTGLEVDHQVAVNFAAFADVVDAVGGVPVAFDQPVRDRATGLHVYEPACRVLSGSEALALARSRKLEMQGADGVWRTDPSASDFGRIARQQVLVAATVEELLTPSLVTRIADLFGVAHDNLVIDDDLSLSTVMGAGWDAVDGVEMRFFSLPATVGWAGAASVVHADETEVAAMRADIAAFLAGPDDLDAESPTSGDGSGTPADPAARGTTSSTVGTPSTSPAAPATGPTRASAPDVDLTGGIHPCS